ncbi:hypothetical protein RJ639_032658 [Escallonia herrerae]|uniref:Uncharacterized protein n=1 Tax=Escallonia herrerae TaxID=1293975 RepID=A0AA89BBF3_9ASTE|nr:hypothetical protein RJ639_032658 [Escallonia herrerae]
MAKRVGMVGRREDESVVTRAVNSVFSFVRYAEFEIIFVLFFVIAFIIFKDLTIHDRLLTVEVYHNVVQGTHLGMLEVAAFLGKGYGGSWFTG